MSSLLVEVVRMDEFEEHPNADRLEIARVKGWRCIVGKGQFKPGDTAVFVPIDAVLPQKLVDELGLDYLKGGERVRTVKLRGVVSQGLLLTNKWGFKEGQDVAKRLGITKWEPSTEPANFIGNRKPTAKEVNPYFFKYNRIEHYKNYPDIFEEGEEVVITEKLHGTSARFGWVPYQARGWRAWRLSQLLLRRFIPEYEFIVGSRNVQLVTAQNKDKLFYDTNVYERVAEKYLLADSIPKGYIFFGEIVGPGVQDLTYGVPEGELEFYLYDVMHEGRYLPYDEFISMGRNQLMYRVPELYRGPYSDEIVRELTVGESTIAPGQIREGVVVKSAYEVPHPHFGRKILKSISEDYLLRKDGTEYH